MHRPHPARRRARPLLLVLAGAIVIALAAAHWWSARAGGGSGGPDGAFPRAPSGFWHPAPRADAPAAAAELGPEERARLVSLPYLQGRALPPAEGPPGVVVHDAAAVQEGLNLYTSGHAPEAILVDASGRALHRWRIGFRDAFPGVAPNSDTAFFRRAHLFPDGRLLALFQTGGLVFLDWHSRPLGRCRGNFYNDLWVGDDGRIWTLGKEAAPAGKGDGWRLDDFLVLLRYEGGGETCRTERRISITEAFRGSPYAGLLEPMAPEGDVLHANTVAELDGALGGLSPIFARGNLLLSLRELDLVAIVDPRQERVVWAQRGPWRAQHEPTLLPSGRILLFDNRGHGGESRLLEVDPLTGEIPWQWSGEPPSSFSSTIGGTAARLANGNTLVTESVPGRAFEIDPGGRVVWELRSPHRAGRDDVLVAMLFEVQRVAPDHLEPGLVPGGR